MIEVEVIAAVGDHYRSPVTETAWNITDFVFLRNAPGIGRISMGEQLFELVCVTSGHVGKPYNPGWFYESRMNEPGWIRNHEG